MSRRGDQIALALGGVALAWLLFPRSQPSPTPPASPGAPGSGYTGTLFALPPEPIASEPHDVWELSPQASAQVTSGGSIPYNGGGAWDPARCATRQTAHALDVAALIRATFPWVRTIGGLRCEARHTWHGDELSIHATGRALDVMAPLPYSSTEGEQLANWALANAQPLGLQLIIWNRKSWQGSMSAATRFANYSSGTTPTTEHRDHVHIEVLA